MKKVMVRIGNSPINYLCDLLIVCMILFWGIAFIIMTIFSVYATIAIRDTSIWKYVTELVVAPLTAGGAIWMIKNSIQHAIAAREGKECKYDFPKPEPDCDENKGT